MLGGPLRRCSDMEMARERKDWTLRTPVDRGVREDRITLCILFGFAAAGTFFRSDFSAGGDCCGLDNCLDNGRCLGAVVVSFPSHTDCWVLWSYV